MELLVLTDFHYAGTGVRSSLPQRRGDLTLELLERVRARERGIDAVAALGDVLEYGRHPDAARNWADIRAALGRFGVPVLSVPGNHDREPERFAQVFGRCEPLVLGRLRLLPFADRYDEADVCTRDLCAMRRTLGTIRPGELAVACQHSAILPEIESDYPYTLPQHAEIARAYREAGVRLSLSGHYHAGLPPFRDGGVLHLCVPALCEAPFSYARVTLGGAESAVSVRTLE